MVFTVVLDCVVILRCRHDASWCSITVWDLHTHNSNCIGHLEPQNLGLGFDHISCEYIYIHTHSLLPETLQGSIPQAVSTLQYHSSRIKAGFLIKGTGYDLKIIPS